MKGENFNKQVLRFAQGRSQRGESELERADAVMHLQSQEQQLITDVIQ